MGSSPYLLNKRIKRLLEDIIDKAYFDESDYMRDKYKGFYLMIDSSNKSSFHGKYKPSSQTITIVNMYRGTGATVATCLHELAHHIDYMKNGVTGHQKPFYLAFRRLIYTSLDMGITQKNDFITTDSSYSNKVKDMIDEYIPHPIKYVPPEEKMIRVKGAYEKRHLLKEFEFSWNSIEQTWEKPLGESPFDNEKKTEAILKSIGIDTYEIAKASLYVDAIVYMCASGNTYNVKDNLRAAGFYYNADNKVWLKKIRSDDFNSLLIKYNGEPRFKGVTFSLFEK